MHAQTRKRIEIELDEHDQIISCHVVHIPPPPPSPTDGVQIKIPFAELPPPCALGGIQTGKPPVFTEKTAIPQQRTEIPAAWRRSFDALTGEGVTWSGYAGRTCDDVLNDLAVRKEITCLELRHVACAVDLVLKHGPQRCSQVRIWATKKAQTQKINSLSGLIIATINKNAKGVTY